MEDSHALAQFAADVAHDLNNPVGGVIGMSQLLLEGKKLGPQERKDVETILAQGQRCRSIIQDLMLFRIPPQKTKERTDLVSLANSILASIRYDFKELGLEVLNSCPPSLPDVDCHAGELRQVILHLLLAIRRLMVGQKEKQLYFEGGEDAGRVFLRFRHTGRPVSETALADIDAGWQISKHILEAHGGTLSIQSPPAAAGFTLELPRSAYL